MTTVDKNESKILHVLRKGVRATIDEINLMIGISHTETALALNKLEKKGLISSVWKENTSNKHSPRLKRVYVMSAENELEIDCNYHFVHCQCTKQGVR